MRTSSRAPESHRSVVFLAVNCAPKVTLHHRAKIVAEPHAAVCYTFVKTKEQAYE